MKKKYLKSIAGLTLVEILIGIVVSSLMMAAMYSTYTIVNNSYNQVVDKAKISRSSRDLVELLIRDIRMSGFKYYLGTNELGYPEQSYLEFVGGTTSIKENHDPIVIVANELGHNIDGTDPTVTKNNAGDLCCDKIHIVFDDFNQNDKLQPYKRYKLTYYALPFLIQMTAIQDMLFINLRLAGNNKEIQRLHRGLQKVIGLVIVLNVTTNNSLKITLKIWSL